MINWVEVDCVEYWNLKSDWKGLRRVVSVLKRIETGLKLAIRGAGTLFIGRTMTFPKLLSEWSFEKCVKEVDIWQEGII